MMNLLTESINKIRIPSSIITILSEPAIRNMVLSEQINTQFMLHNYISEYIFGNYIVSKIVVRLLQLCIKVVKAMSSFNKTKYRRDMNSL